MTKQAAHGKRKKHSHAAPTSNDAGVYIGIVMMGAFLIMLGGLLMGGRWQEIAIGFLIAMAVLTNLYAFRAFRGSHLAPWQAALARLPMRFAGFGRRGGKPLEAAKGDSGAKLMILMSVAFCSIVIAGLSVILIGT